MPGLPFGAQLRVWVGVNGVDGATEEWLKARAASDPNLHMLAWCKSVSPAEARNRLILASGSRSAGRKEKTTIEQTETANGAATIAVAATITKTVIVTGTDDWVFFLDDDAFVPANYFEVIAPHLNSELAALGGPNLTPPTATRFSRATGAALSSRWATYCTVARYRAEGSTRAAGEESLILCNLWVRRSWLGARAFPAEMICAEENAFLAAAAARGARFLHVPSLHVWHERRPNPRALAAQVFKYGRGRVQLWGNEGGDRRLAHLVPALCVLYSLGLMAGWVLGSGSTAGLAPFAIYLALGTIFAARVPGVRGIRERSLVLAIFCLIHGAYALGVLREGTARARATIRAPKRRAPKLSWPS